jgi:iron complex transport system substrate-binding protein
MLMFHRHRRLLAVAVLVPVALAACGDDDDTTTGATTAPATTAAASTTAASAAAAGSFPVTVADDTGEVTIAAQPTAIVSLSPSLTETLFAVGAGEQVIAVDELSNFPDDAPVTDLSGFEPNLEAIAAHEPDLVLVSDDIGDVVAGLRAIDVPVLLFGAPVDMDGAYTQIERIGAATGHVGEAAELVAQMQTDIDAIVARVPARDAPLTYYHELDATYFSITSETFLGELYGLLGLRNIADAAAGAADSGGYPQLSAEYIVDANPDMIFLADASFGESPETVAARPGWGSVAAITTGAVFPVNEDLASRWGPRVVEYLDTIATHVETVAATA